MNEKPIIFAVALAVSMCEGACGIPPTPPPQLDPQTIAARLREAGPRAVVAELVSSGEWDFFQQRLIAGDGRWIALVPQIAVGTDAGPAEEVSDDLGLALLRNPSAVLKIADPQNGPVFGIDRICRLKKLNNLPNGLPLHYTEDALKELRSIGDKSVDTIRKKCATLLMS